MDWSKRLESQFERRHVPCGGGRYLLTYSGGEGKETLVFLHGAASSWWSFRHQYRHLVGEYRIVAPNFRGHGGTPWTETEQLEDFYADICQWFVSMDFPEPVTIVSHSLGGYLGARYASEHSSRVRRLVLMNSCGNFEWGFARAFLEYCWPGADLVRRLLPGLVSVNSYMAGCLAKVIFPQWNCWDIYPKLTMPTLIIFGTFDPLFSLKQGRRMAALIPNSHFEILPCSGHNPQLDHAREVNRLVRDFLKAPSAPYYRSVSLY